MIRCKAVHELIPVSANLAYINPAIIAWARQLRGLTFAQLSTSQLKADQIRAWEEGRGLPTHPQAEALANKLKIPFLVLFLSEPPDLKVPIPDLRTMSGEPARELSPEFLDVINNAMVRQDWYRDSEIKQNAQVLTFVGKFRRTDDPTLVARDIQKTLGITDDMRQNSTSWKEFLDDFTSNAEALGILVFKSSIVGHATNRKLTVREFRGFVLSDKIAPVIFTFHDDDAKAAQTFTLAHELAHIWINESGISDPQLKKRPAEFGNAIERFCNQVAAEVLTPRGDFVRRWNQSLSVMRNVTQLSAHYRVSSLVILITAHDLGKIDDEAFSKAFDSELQRFREQDKKEKAKLENKAKKGGNFWASFVIRNSKRFTDKVVRSAREGRERYTDAASLLGVKANSLEKYLHRLDTPR